MGTTFATDMGLERVQRSITLHLAENLNDQIAARTAEWALHDTLFYTALGRDDPEFTIEQIPSSSFFPGHNPNLIDQVKELFPSCSVIAYVGTPQNSTDDWGELYQIRIAIELMAKSVRSEEEVDVRVRRLAEAAHACFLGDLVRNLPDVDGSALIPRMANTPTVTFGDVFIRHEGVDPEARWYWQGGRLEYIIDKYQSY